MSFTYRYTGPTPTAFVQLSDESGTWVPEPGDTIETETFLTHPWLELVEGQGSGPAPDPIDDPAPEPESAPEPEPEVAPEPEVSPEPEPEIPYDDTPGDDGPAPVVPLMT